MSHGLLDGEGAVAAAGGGGGGTHHSINRDARSESIYFHSEISSHGIFKRCSLSLSRFLFSLSVRTHIYLLRPWGGRGTG